MADPLHYIHPSISNFHTARTSTPWLITILYLCFTSIHSWDGPNLSPFCLLCAIMSLGQSSTLQYPLSLEPRHFLSFHLSLGCILWERRISVFISPFRFLMDTIEAIFWPCARGAGRAEEMAIVLLSSTLPSNLLCFSFYVLCRVDRHLAMDAGESVTMS
jgi:hypothetical protein